ncbi:hypothetical protein BS50DRAFT_144065 [Corynespora cassiicola Philippines]|uniref:Uncharacterized protein n=1 Tax=Corynespora cassiicola Philippines TaxID=1448308 RepID=A0A2T2N8D0_CORCC|nr:hypothetical protein BS50DRAFT_144065 [Corynespora cassiicola Philippines]
MECQANSAGVLATAHQRLHLINYWVCNRFYTRDNFNNDYSSFGDRIVSDIKMSLC